jgi:hypothetical protein
MSVDRFQLGDCIPLQELKQATAEQVGAVVHVMLP